MGEDGHDGDNDGSKITRLSSDIQAAAEAQATGVVHHVSSAARALPEADNLL